MLKKMQEVQANSGSKLHMRSESIQNRRQAKRIPMLKKELKKKSKLLVIADLAIPFNPETGEEDEKFNVDSKYRPPFSATTVALTLKAMANENEATKKAFMRRAGVNSWDTSSEEFTEEDKAIFAKYRVPRIFTVPVVHVNIPTMTQNDFGRDYSIAVAYDEMTGEVQGIIEQDGSIGDIPGVLKVNKLFRDRIWEEIKDFDERLKLEDRHLTDKQIKEEKSRIYAKNPVSDVQPSNWITAIELPLTNNYKLNGEVDYTNIVSDDVHGKLVLSRLSKKMKDAIAKYTDGSWSKFDQNFDFFELDMACPAEGDPSTQQGKMDIGKDTEFEKPTESLNDDLPENNVFHDALTEYLDNCADIEEEVRRSMFISPYTPEVENQIYTSLPTVVDLENDKYFTQSVLNANREVISIAFAGSGDEILDAIDAGISDAPVGALDEKASAAEAKKYSLDSSDFTDGAEDDCTVDLEQVTID